MFGLLRTVLALMVMTFHLFIGLFPLGFYAVFGFYTISGYLMTLIMHESYGYSLQGRLLFIVNRFLRLYPLYWSAMIFSIALILILGQEIVSAYHASIYIPTSWLEYLSNIFMLFVAWYPNNVDPRLVPPTWALTVEIFFYLLICLGISKTYNRVKIWFFLSVGYVIYSLLVDWPRPDRYFPLAAASLPFSLGAMIFFLSKRDDIYKIYSRIGIRSSHLFFIMLLNCVIWMYMTQMKIGNMIEIGMYLNQTIFTLLIYSIVRGDEIIRFKKNIDKFIGDFSYPIYLLHWQSGLLISYLLFGKPFHEFSIKGLVSILVTVVFIFVLSFSLNYLIDRPICNIREKLKG